MSNDYIAPIVAKLTLNAAINLRNAVLHPCPLNPENVHGKGRIHTGLGKWTTLAARGVENNMIALGLAERRGPWDHVHITPLGREVATYVTANWDDLEFREGGHR